MNLFFCLDEKYCVNIVFCIFQYLIASERISQQKIVFNQHKKYSLVLEIVFY